MNLWDAEEGVEYTVDRIESGDEELESFLFTLGCFSGEPITVVMRRKRMLIVAIKDGRYSVDRRLAESVFLR